MFVPNIKTKLIEGLFFAGQINGTTGRGSSSSRASGLNAAKLANSEELFVLIGPCLMSAY